MRLLVAFAAAVAALLLLSGPSVADATQLVGTVGPGFTISLKGVDGAPVTHLAPGTYQLLVHDLSEEHDFHLFGPSGSVGGCWSVRFPCTGGRFPNSPILYSPIDFTNAPSRG